MPPPGPVLQSPFQHDCKNATAKPHPPAFRSHPPRLISPEGLPRPTAPRLSGTPAVSHWACDNQSMPLHQGIERRSARGSVTPCAVAHSVTQRHAANVVAGGRIREGCRYHRL